MDAYYRTYRLLGSDGSIHMLTYRKNIDEEKQQEYKMQHLAQIDEMTGLYNKAAIRHKIESLLLLHPDHLFGFFILILITLNRQMTFMGTSLAIRLLYSLRKLSNIISAATISLHV